MCVLNGWISSLSKQKQMMLIRQNVAVSSKSGLYLDFIYGEWIVI